MRSLLCVGLGVALLAGCTSSNEKVENPLGTQEGAPAQLAAFAASAKYPGGQAADLRAGVLLDESHRTVRIVNFTDQPLRNAKVWVNNTYVQPVSSIPPRGSVVLAEKNFYDNTGHSLSQLEVVPNSIQIETSDNHLYNLMGPIHVQ